MSVGRFKRIQHSYPVRGHSFLPNDRDFSHTEINKRKNKKVVFIIQKARVPDYSFEHPTEVCEGNFLVFLQFNPSL